MTAGVPTGVDETYRGFLFADLRGYTADVERHGDRAASALLDTYRALVRGQVAAHAGAEIKTEGDSFYVVFGTARRAVQCALDIVAAADEYNAAKPAFPIRVGVGVHAGEVVEGSEGYVGSAVNLAARICSIAHAGDVLVSGTVRDLTRAGQNVEYVARGTRRFKGVREPIAIYAARPSGAPSAPRTGSRLPTRAPSGRSLGALGLALAVGLLAFAGAILFGDQLLGLGGAAEQATPTAKTSATTAGGASEGPSLSAAPSDGTAFPNAAEAALLARLDPALVRSCGRAEPADSPPVGAGDRGSGRGMAVLAGVLCAPAGDANPDVVEFWSSKEQPYQTIETVFFGWTGVRELPPGDCSTQDRAYGTWETPLFRACSARRPRARRR